MAARAKRNTTNERYYHGRGIRQNLNLVRPNPFESILLLAGFSGRRDEVLQAKVCDDVAVVFIVVADVQLPSEALCRSPSSGKMTSLEMEIHSRQLDS